MTLHFQLLRYLSCFFVVASVLTLPVILLGMSGGRLATVPMAINIDALRVAKLSIANIGLPSSTANGTFIDDVVLQPWGAISSYAFSHRAGSIVITVCDLVMILLFFAFCALCHRLFEWRIQNQR